MLKKPFITKKMVPETFDFLVSFVPYNIFDGHETQRDMRIKIMS